MVTEKRRKYMKEYMKEYFKDEDKRKKHIKVVKKYDSSEIGKVKHKIRNKRWRDKQKLNYA